MQCVKSVLNFIDFLKTRPLEYRVHGDRRTNRRMEVNSMSRNVTPCTLVGGTEECATSIFR
jgi:hypothetical protein